MDSDFDAAVLGQSMPQAVEQALQEAGAHRSDPARAMAALMRAQALAPDHPAVLIALYRHHFYGHRLRLARNAARQALVVGAGALALPTVWRDVPRRPLPGARHDARTRFYLFLLKGYAYLSLRMGDGPEARDALNLLRALDPEDCVGGALLEAVRQRSLASTARADTDVDDADEEADAEAREVVPATGAAAWSRLPVGA